ncbi:MAG: adenine-specific DNA-methyltransferase [Phycisphaerales bacterium]|jgi:site-specific DNA-methyltransferase (adenine-specific)|nr:adenine-specific DNA-methyltransferase [Phycisphaerales bacterium]
MTEVFRNDATTIYHGDALDVLKESIADLSVDLIFADPPYNIGKRFGNSRDHWPSDAAYASWCFQWIDLCLKKLKRTGSIYLMTSTQAMPHLDLHLRSRATILSRIVWHYDSSGVQARKYFGSMYEPILFAVKDVRKYTFNADEIKVEARTGATRKLIDYRKPVPVQYNTTKVPGNVWTFSRVRYRMDEYEEHPTQKPESLMQRIIKASSRPGDVVLDPFSGTFTTCAVAQKLGRRSVGIERELDYVEIGLRRLGIASTFQGKALEPPRKTFKRRAVAGGFANDNGLFELV